MQVSEVLHYGKTLSLMGEPSLPGSLIWTPGHRHRQRRGERGQTCCTQTTHVSQPWRAPWLGVNVEETPCVTIRSQMELTQATEDTTLRDLKWQRPNSNHQVFRSSTEVEQIQTEHLNAPTSIFQRQRAFKGQTPAKSLRWCCFSDRTDCSRT